MRQSITRFSQPLAGNITSVSLFSVVSLLLSMNVRGDEGYKRWKIKTKELYLHCLVDDSGFLQQILRYLCSNYRSATGELHLQVFAEAAGVVVDGGAGITECLHQTVDQQDFLLERSIIGLKKEKRKHDATSVQQKSWHSYFWTHLLLAGTKLKQTEIRIFLSVKLQIMSGTSWSVNRLITG